MAQMPVIFIRPEMMTAEVKAQAANAGVSVSISDRVPEGQVFVYDPEGQLAARREVVELYDAALAEHEPAAVRWPGQRLLSRTSRFLSRR